MRRAPVAVALALALAAQAASAAMEDLSDVSCRWDQCLAGADAEKAGIERQIRAVRDSTRQDKGAPPGGFFSKLERGLRRGVQLLAARKQIWSLERRLASCQRGVGAEALRIRGQLQSIALAIDANSRAKASFDRLPAQSKALDRLRRNVAAVIQDLNKSADAEDAAWKVNDQGYAREAETLANRASDSIDDLVGALTHPPPGLGNGDWGRLQRGEFRSLIQQALRANLAGDRAWTATQMLPKMRGAIDKLQALDRAIGKALQSIEEQRRELARQAMAAACADDAAFGRLHVSVARWQQGQAPPAIGDFDRGG